MIINLKIWRSPSERAGPGEINRVPFRPISKYHASKDKYIAPRGRRWIFYSFCILIYRGDDRVLSMPWIRLYSKKKHCRIEMANAIGTGLSRPGRHSKTPLPPAWKPSRYSSCFYDSVKSRQADSKHGERSASIRAPLISAINLRKQPIRSSTRLTLYAREIIGNYP